MQSQNPHKNVLARVKIAMIFIIIVIIILRLRMSAVFGLSRGDPGWNQSMTVIGLVPLKEPGHHAAGVPVTQKTHRSQYLEMCWCFWPTCQVVKEWSVVCVLVRDRGGWERCKTAVSDPHTWNRKPVVVWRQQWRFTVNCHRHVANIEQECSDFYSTIFICWFGCKLQQIKF